MRFRLKRARPSAAALDSPRGPRSLFREILNWMLLPFLILWPLSLVAVYKMAIVLADQPHDAALAQSVRVLSRQVLPATHGLSVDFPVPPETLLRDDGEDAIYYQVLGPRREFISGERDLALGTLPPHVRSGEVYFRDDQLRGRDVRVAFQFVRLDTEPPDWAQVQVAETRHKRNLLAYQIIAGVVLPQLAMLPLAVWLVYLGLARGISPLDQLRKLIRSRRPDDLSPIDTARVPHEVRPLVGAFNAMMHRLSTNLNAQKRFIADAAHQMRTPLTGLKIQTELAINETDPEQLRRLLPNLALSVNRACHLINQLLILARAESRSTATPDQAVDLEALVVETASAMVMQARGKNIDLEVIRPYAAVIIRGDPLLLRELIKNLLDNAIKYTPAGGHLLVRLEASERAVIDIQDDGIGIPQAERAHVFERFYRVLGTSSEGSGLGLSIVREIANHHRATVELLDSPAGKGCLVRASFPLAMQAAANSPAIDTDLARQIRPGFPREVSRLSG